HRKRRLRRRREAGNPRSGDGGRRPSRRPLSDALGAFSGGRRKLRGRAERGGRRGAGRRPGAFRRPSRRRSRRSRSLSRGRSRRRSSGTRGDESATTRRSTSDASREPKASRAGFPSPPARRAWPADTLATRKERSVSTSSDSSSEPSLCHPSGSNEQQANRSPPSTRSASPLESVSARSRESQPTNDAAR